MKTRWVYLFVFFIPLLIYLPILANGFVFDDAANTILNRTIQAKDYIFMAIYGVSATFTGPYYRPIIFILYGIIYRLFGEQAFWFHMPSLILHAVNTVLVYSLLVTFFSRGTSVSKPRLYACIAALVFGAHPINVEAIAPIASMQELLYALGILSAIWSLIHIKSSWIRAFALFFWMMIAPLSKEAGVLVYPLVLLTNWYIAKRPMRPVVLISIAALTFYMMLRLGIANVSLIANKTNSPTYIAITHAPLSVRLLTTPKIFSYYVSTYFYPKNLAILQQWVVRSINLRNVYVPLAINIALLMSIVVLYKKRRDTLIPFFFMWYLINVAFHSNLIIKLDMTVSDRFLYMAQIGILGILAIFINTVNHRLSTRTIIVFSTILLSALIIRTELRISNWRSDFALFTHDAQVSKDSMVLQNNYAILLLQEKKYTEAKHLLDSIIDKKPVIPGAYYNRGLYEYVVNKNIDKAIEYLEKDRESETKISLYQSLGLLYLQKNTPNKAVHILLLGLKENPNSEVLTSLLAYAYAKNGQKTIALDIAQHLMETFPSEDINTLYVAIRDNKDLDMTLSVGHPREY